MKVKREDGRILDYGFTAMKEEFGVDLATIRPKVAKKIDKEAVAAFKDDKEYVDVECLGVLRIRNKSVNSLPIASIS